MIPLDDVTPVYFIGQPTRHNFNYMNVFSNNVFSRQADMKFFVEKKFSFTN